VQQQPFVELRILGHTELSSHGDRTGSFVLRQPKRIALLAYLAMATAGGYRRRDQIVALFWPELDQTHARTQLRKVLHALRSTIGSDTLVSRGEEEIRLDPSLFWWHRFGKCFLGATHGHTIKLREMPLLMASRRAEDWGKSKFRYIHGFHIHHKEMTATENKGVITESHQTPIPKDAWHFGAGYEAARSVSSITYHQEFGEVSRSRVAILDA